MNTKNLFDKSYKFSNQRQLSFLFLGSLLFIALFSIARADVHVTSGLSSTETRVGEPVQLQIKVEGSFSADLPQSISVDGLDIHFVQRSTQVHMENFKITQSGVFVYLVTPLKEGDFTIPSFSLQVGGKTYHTDAMSLRVGASSDPRHMPPANISTPGSSPTSPSTDTEGRPAFAELLVPKKSAYVGELIPIEIRFYFDRRVRMRLQDRPQFAGEGFTGGTLGEPMQTFQEIDGVPYEVWKFQTGIMPVKSGTLKIEPATLTVVAESRNRGMPNIDDIFQQFFSGGGFPQGLGGSEEFQVRTNDAEVDVQLLPKEGRPAHFSGAIGEFSLKSSAEPLKAGPGDPITLRTTISGRGNFDGMGNPELTEADGWRVYPPKENFKPEDAIGFGGTKTFESLLIAKKAMTQTPGVEFSYFDPNVHQYKTLVAPPMKVEADAEASATVASTDSSHQKKGASPQDENHGSSETKASQKSEWTPLRVASWESHFTPAWDHSVFIGIQMACGLTLLGWLGMALFRSIQQSDTLRRSQEVKAQTQLLSEMRTEEKSQRDFYALAIDWLVREVARSGHALSSNHPSAEEILSGRVCDPETATAIRRIFERYNETQYSGPRMDQPVPQDEKEGVITVLRAFSKSGGKR